MTLNRDPAQLGWPPTLPVELALRTASVQDICESYGISAAEWKVMRTDPALIEAVREAASMLKTEGVSFKIKAQLQAEELLRTSWTLIHDDNTPPNVKADLIKFTIRVAGRDPTANRADSLNGVRGLQINIDLGG